MRDRVALALAGLALLAVVAHWGWQTAARRREVEDLRKQVAYLTSEVVYLQKQVAGGTPSDEESTGTGRLRQALARLGSRDLLQRYQAAQTVRGYGDEAVPGLVRLVAGEDARARESALLLLAQTNVNAALPELRKMAKEGLEPGVDAQGLRLRDGEVAALLGILARQEDAESVPLFTLGLDSASEAIRGASLIGARRVLALDLLPPLVARLRKERRPVAKQIETVVCQMCSRDPEGFQARLRDLPPRSRFEVARVLSADRSANCRLVLRKLADDPDRRVATAAMEFLASGRPETPAAQGGAAAAPRSEREIKGLAGSLLKELRKEIGH
jgi:HEAT repeat protein